MVHVARVGSQSIELQYTLRSCDLVCVSYDFTEGWGTLGIKSGEYRVYRVCECLCITTQEGKIVFTVFTHFKSHYKTQQVRSEI